MWALETGQDSEAGAVNEGFLGRELIKSIDYRCNLASEHTVDRV